LNRFRDVNISHKGTKNTKHGRALCVLRVLCVFVVAVAFGAGCRQDMHDQPKYKPYRGSDFFGDRRSARPLLEGTVARGHLREDAHLYTGRVNGQLADSFPFPVTEAVLARGGERYGIYCTPCHGLAGYGDGIVVARGYKKASSFHVDRVRNEPPGYFYDVIANGFGAMPSYAAQIPVEDRWAIVAYVRALQLSQHATLADVPPEKRAELGAPAASAAPAAEGHR
jgi:mono/diheme cytochrome c family protein